MERQATVQVNFKLSDLKSQINSTVTGLGRGVGESTGLGNDRRMKEQAEATKGLAKSMEGLATAAMATGFAMTGFVSAASPDAIDTLWGSFKLLSGEIGMTLLPAVVSTSGWLQRTADWVRNLDEGTRGAIGTFATWTAGLALGGFALQKVGSFAATAWEGLKNAGSAAKTLVSQIGFMPTAGIAAVSVAVGILAAKFAEAAANAERALDTLQAMRDNPGGSINARELERNLTPEERQSLLTLEGEARQQWLDTKINELRERLRQLQAGNPQAAAAGVERNIQATHNLASNAGLGSFWSVANPLAPISAMLSLPSMGISAWTTLTRTSDKAIANAAAGISGAQGTAQTELSLRSLERVRDHGLPAGFGTGSAGNKVADKPMIASSFQSRQFSSASNYYDTIVQRALSGNELNKRLEQLQEEGNILLGQIRDRMPSSAPPI